MRYAALALVAVLGFLPAASPQQNKQKKFKVYPGTGIDWKGDWEEALKEAQARNVPIMLAVHMDG